MKISIVTISFNQVEFLKECIESIINQPDYIELIVVDPGSTDGSRELIDLYGDRIIKVFEKDNGPADGLNRGFSKSTGNILGFINSDDALVPKASRIILDAFEDGKTDAICGTGYFIDENNRKIGQTAGSKFSAWLYSIDAVTVFQQSTFFSRKAFDLTNGFNVNNKTCWDSELFFDMSMKGISFKPVWGKIGLFRLHTNSISVSGKFSQQREKDLKRIKQPFSNKFNLLFKRFNLYFKLLADPTYMLRKGTIQRDPFKRLNK